MLNTDKICPIMFMTSHLGGLCQGEKCMWYKLCQDGIDLAGINIKFDYMEQSIRESVHVFRQLKDSIDREVRDAIQLLRELKNAVNNMNIPNQP